MPKVDPPAARPGRRPTIMYVVLRLESVSADRRESGIAGVLVVYATMEAMEADNPDGCLWVPMMLVRPEPDAASLPTDTDLEA